MKSAATPLYQTFLYDFSRDGGAIGAIRTGIQIPNKASIVALSTYTNVAIVGAASVSLGTTTSVNLLSNAPVALGAPEPIGNRAGFFGTTKFAIMDTTLNIIFTIAGAPITAGRFSVYIRYFMFQ